MKAKVSRETKLQINLSHIEVDPDFYIKAVVPRSNDEATQKLQLTVRLSVTALLGPASTTNMKNHKTSNKHMEMEGASKKRKLCHEDDDQDNEEEKMEKFFALVKSIREARDRLMNGSDHAPKATDDHMTMKRKLEEDRRQQVAVWKPTFQHEDFMEDKAQFKNPAAITLVDSSKRKEEVTDQKEENKEVLDLTLSL